LLQNRLAKPVHTGKTLWTRLEERVSGPHAIFEWLKKLGKREPLVVILEDIDWIDPDSASLLNQISEQLNSLPLLLAVTRRESASNFNGVSTLPLTKLPDKILIEVAQRALGARSLDKTLAQWICLRAGGNPLYARELCQALEQAEAVLLDRESGEARWMGLEPALPLSLHGLLLARLDELPLTYQDILKRAAVMGMSFEEAGLVRLCRPQIGEVEVAAALDELERISFLTAAAPASYQFYHPLMQEAIYATLAYTQRQHWHTRIGDWLVESQTEPEYGPELIAYHYLHGAEMAKAARYGRLAGDRARERGAYAGAIEYYVKVLTLTNTPLDERIRAAEGRADVLALQGDYRAA
jgi:predicted ATPase